MDGLSAIINADAWVWTLGCQVKPNEAQEFVGFIVALIMRDSRTIWRR